MPQASPRFTHGRKHPSKALGSDALPHELAEILPLWQLDIAEVTGHNLEARGREEVNRLLAEGWLLLHIYTLKYQEDGVWRERPMAILGRPRAGARPKLLRQRHRKLTANL